MAYDVNLSDGSRLTLIADRTLDTSSSIKLLGRNYPGYGEIMAENMVQMLEHFAKDQEPINPIKGQVWFNTTTNTLFVYDGENWSYAGGAGNENATAIDCSPIEDIHGEFHPAMRFKVDGTVVAIMSSDVITFEPSTRTGLRTNFPTIGQGINLNMSGTDTDGEAGNFKLRGRSVEAEFADLAEMYESDMPLVSGDLVKIGGDKEVTKNTDAGTADVFGVVSTSPAFLLNSGKKALELHYPIALIGRVPVKVVGKVVKGQRLIASNIPGVAVAVANKDVKFALQVVGRALESKDTDEVGLIEAVVGVR
jgi:hypothetical protein